MVKYISLASAVCAASLLFSCGEQPVKKTVAQPEPAKAAVAASEQGPVFTNPIIPNGADPWLQFYNGNYYLTTTTWTSQLVMRKSPTLAGLATATPINIWSESSADRCCNFWAFEFHRLMSPKGPRWYVMYTSGTKDNFDGQHLSVIESEGDDPMGPYTYKGSPMPKSWNIDGTYLEVNNELYLLWSEWQKDEQLLWAAKMSNPWTIVGEKKIISHPTFDWEKSGMKVNEGPEVLQKDGKTMIVFSASFCNTQDYKLGVLELNGKDPLAENAWHKIEKPFFEKANGVFGPGHNGFFKSPDGTEDWLVYHGNSKAEEGCGPTRALRAQKFTWSESANGPVPNLGQPAANGQKLASPSGENGPIRTIIPGTKVQLVNKANNLCLNTEGGTAACSATSEAWTLDYTTDGQYRLVNGQGLTLVNKDTGYGPSLWQNDPAQQWKIAIAALPPEAGIWFNLNNQGTHKPLIADNCNGADCTAWRIQPAGESVIASAQSGKVVSAAKAEKNKPAALEQDEWNQKSAQRWQFVHVENGFYSMQNANKQCIGVTGKAITPGFALTAAECGDKTAQWWVDYQPNGTQKLINRVSGLVVDVASCGVANHTPLNLAPNLNTICQQFRLLPVGQ